MIELSKVKRCIADTRYIPLLQKKELIDSITSIAEPDIESYRGLIDDILVYVFEVNPKDFTPDINQHIEWLIRAYLEETD